MSTSYAGGCACGAIRFETGEQPIFQNHCQCLDCQKRSGSGHSSSRSRGVVSGSPFLVSSS